MLSWAPHIKMSKEVDLGGTKMSLSLIYGLKIADGKTFQFTHFACDEPDMALVVDKHECNTVRASYYTAYACAIVLVALTALYTQYQPELTKWKLASVLVPTLTGVFILIMLGTMAHALHDMPDFGFGGPEKLPIKLAFDGFVYALWMVALCGGYIAALLTAPNDDSPLEEPFL